MTASRYLVRRCTTDGNENATNVDKARLLPEIDDALQDETFLRVEIERGDLDDLVRDYHEGQLRTSPPVERRFPHVDPNLRLWTPWTGTLQMETSGDDLSEHGGPPVEGVLYVDHATLRLSLFGPYWPYAARVVGHTIKTLNEQHLWLLPMAAPAVEMAVVVAYWGDGKPRGKGRCVRSASIGWVHHGRLPEWWFFSEGTRLYAHRQPQPEYVLGIQCWPLATGGGPNGS